MTPNTLSKNNTDILNTILSTLNTIKEDINKLKNNDEVIKADISKLKKSDEIVIAEINKLRNDMSQNTSEIHKLRNDMHENIKDMASEVTHIYNSIETIKTEMRLQRGMLNLIPQIYEIVFKIEEKNVENERDHTFYYQKIGEHDTRLRKLENTQ